MAKLLEQDNIELGYDAAKGIHLHFLDSSTCRE